jgi:parallel beta-helix repeat protein
MPRVIRLVVPILLACAVAPGLATTAREDAPIATPAVATPVDLGPPTRTVHAGESIQATVDAAQPGDVIGIEPGTYLEAVLIRTPDLTLLGRGGPGDEPVVIENPGGATNGVEVLDEGDGFVLANVTVRGFDVNGVVLSDVDGFLLRDVTAEDNGEYGFFPVLSANGVIVGCIARGHADAGIYIGQSERIEIRANTAFDNVSGILVENVRSVQSPTTRATATAPASPRCCCPAWSGLRRRTSSSKGIGSTATTMPPSRRRRSWRRHSRRASASSSSGRIA